MIYTQHILGYVVLLVMKNMQEYIHKTVSLRWNNFITTIVTHCSRVIISTIIIIIIIIIIIDKDQFRTLSLLLSFPLLLLSLSSSSVTRSFYTVSFLQQNNQTDGSLRSICQKLYVTVDFLLKSASQCTVTGKGSRLTSMPSLPCVSLNTSLPPAPPPKKKKKKIQRKRKLTLKMYGRKKYKLCL